MPAIMQEKPMWAEAIRIKEWRLRPPSLMLRGHRGGRKFNRSRGSKGRARRNIEQESRENLRVRMRVTENGFYAEAEKMPEMGLSKRYLTMVKMMGSIDTI